MPVPCEKIEDSAKYDRQGRKHKSVKKLDNNNIENCQTWDSLNISEFTAEVEEVIPKLGGA